MFDLILTPGQFIALLKREVFTGSLCEVTIFAFKA